MPLATVNSEEYMKKMYKIGKILNSAYALFEANTKDLFMGVSNRNPDVYGEMQENITFLDFEQLTKGDGEIKKCDPKDIAFIQFTSGSTGSPKGVMLKHRNLVANIDAILSKTEVTDKDSSLSWMPLSHDMGLIGFHLSPFAKGINHYIIPTHSFVLNPLMWLRIATEYKATVLSSPNFGYIYYLKAYRRNKEGHTLDLSNIRVIFNGAEPISVDICNEFLEEMSIFGLRKNAMFTVYGLAEACLAVAFPNVNDELRYVQVDRRHLGNGENVVLEDGPLSLKCVIEGKAVKHCEIEIRDEYGAALLEDIVGYICIKGKNVTEGFINDSEKTKEVIDENGWLNTGDLGFLHNDELIVTGRAKDIIFVNGANYYSSDLENIIAKIDGIKSGKIAVCACQTDERADDDVVIFLAQKMKKDILLDKIEQIKTILWIEAGIPVNYVIPVKTIPKTTSGKIQHYKLAEQYRNHEFDNVIADIEEIKDEQQKRKSAGDCYTETEKTLVQMYKEIFQIKDINIDENITHYGANSLLLTQIYARVNEAFSKDISISNIYECYTIRKMAKFIDDQKEYIPYSAQIGSENVNSIHKHRYQFNKTTGNILDNLEGKKYPKYLYLLACYYENWMECLNDNDEIKVFISFDEWDYFDQICIKNREYEDLEEFMEQLEKSVRECSGHMEFSRLDDELKVKKEGAIYLGFGCWNKKITGEIKDFFDHFMYFDSDTIEGRSYSPYFDQKRSLEIMDSVVDLALQI